MTKIQSFFGTLQGVQRQASEWLEGNPLVRLTRMDDPRAVPGGGYRMTVWYDDPTSTGPTGPGELFQRCGQALCGSGPDWKAQFGRMLDVKPDTVDAMTKGKSRIPPGVWGDVAAFLHDRLQTNLPALTAAALHASGTTLARTYRVCGLEFRVEAAADGRWPRVKYSETPDNQAGWWHYVEDGDRFLPDTTSSVALEFDGESGLPFRVGDRMRIHYPKNMKRAA